MKAPFTSHSPQKLAVNARGENLLIAIPDGALPVSKHPAPSYTLYHTKHRPRPTEEGTEVLRVKPNCPVLHG